MAETETADTSKNVIKVEEEIEGDQIGTKNYRFSKIGESVPIKSDADFKFDMDNLPSRPMAVSERFGVIIVAHSSGKSSFSFGVYLRHLMLTRAEGRKYRVSTLTFVSKLLQY